MRATLFLLVPLTAATVGCSDPVQDSGLDPIPGELMAGMSRARIPAPLGIGTAGYGPFDAPDSPSPYAEIYPATTRIHGHPEIKTTIISRGDDFELIFMRLDTVGVFQQLRRALVLEVEERSGRDIDDALVIGATHTHQGPGRVLDADGFFELIADSFFPEFYDRLIDQLADSIEQAWDDLEPARVGHVMADAPDGHGDRRCEDGLDHKNSSVPVIAVERDGELEALVMAYAVHGTVLDIGDLTLSQDVSGAVEQAVEDSFDHPVMVSMYDSWGADMSPSTPDLEAQEGASMPDGYDSMEAIGQSVTAAVQEALQDLDPQEEPEIAARTFRVAIDREHIGYGDDVFEYDYGAVYCTADGDCKDPQPIEGLDSMCIPFNEEYPAPDQTLYTAGQLGDLHFITFTGEPGTLLAEYVMDGMQAHDGVEDTMFLGYTQDYLGYSVLEDDWWLGGYEASGALWGPRQGSYLADKAVAAFDEFMGVGFMGFQPAPIWTFDDPEYDSLVPESAVDFGSVLQQVEASYGITDTVVFAVAGSDPWLGAPLAVLETSAGEPVLRAGGQAADSDSYLFWVDLTPDPPYDESASARSFQWQFSLPVQHRYPISGLALEGDYQLRVSLPDEDGGSSEVVSEVFEVVR